MHKGYSEKKSSLLLKKVLTVPYQCTVQNTAYHLGRERILEGHVTYTLECTVMLSSEPYIIRWRVVH